MDKSNVLLYGDNLVKKCVYGYTSRIRSSSFKACVLIKKKFMYELG